MIIEDFTKILVDSIKVKKVATEEQAWKPTKHFDDFEIVFNQQI